MLFNSVQFLFFFPLVTLVYFLLPHKFRWIHLLVASCVFYMAFIPAYILILLFTILIDYVAGIMIEKATLVHKKNFLILSIIANLGMLAFFKYFNFFIENINHLLLGFHITTHEITYLNIILPIGLSFHTFQAMSYTIEVYKGNQKAERHLGIYALYVMFYPQLVAGPIERPQNLLQQFKEPHQFNSENLLTGLRLMLWGFFKKLVIADRLAIYVNTVYNHPSSYHYLNLIIATLFFTIQIYCDFSGYSDIAIGAAKTMGFHLMTNFNRPYFSKNIQEFWRRWHISLSTWFKDYLYITLGGNRVNISRVYFNLALVFLISGFWHGANWTFIMWGALHTIYTLIYLIIQKRTSIHQNKTNHWIRNLFTTLFTFIVVAFAWIFFRANNIHQAITIVMHIFTFYNDVKFKLIVFDAEISNAEFGIISTTICVLMIVLMFAVEKKYKPALIEFNKASWADILFCSSVLLLVIILGVYNDNSFIYFQF